MAQKLLRYLPFLSGMFFVVGIVACGDDSSGPSEQSEGNGSIESVDDLPACTDSLSGKFVELNKVVYACTGEKWQVVDGFAKGICNIEECSKNTEGLYTYVEKSEKVYQCKSGVWRDANGKGFSEEEYMGCYVESIVKKTVSSLKDLDKCTDAAKDDIFAVAGELYVCANQKYSPLKVVTISERYLPKCTVDSAYTYVLAKMKSAVCSKGLWYIDGKPVKDPIPASSSSATAKSSSSSKKATSPSSVATTDDPTPVRGICLASVKSAEKGTEVEWNFINMGGTPVTYDWKFSEEGLTSSAKSPKVVFAKPGIKGATLVVNRGLESESEEIECIAMEVSGILVTGCECTLEESFSHKVSEGNPGIAKWAVSGCSGASPFTYAWDVDKNATGNTVTVPVTTSGEVSPEVTVTNSDGESMTASCPAITAVAKITATCSIRDGIAFVVSNVANWENTYSDDLTMVFSGSGGYYKDVSLSRYYTQLYLENLQTTGLYSYSLIYDGDTVCTVASGTCGPAQSPIEKGGKTAWKLNAPGGYSAKSYSWSFAGAASATSTDASPEITYTDAGTATATLTLDKGSNTEVSLACTPLTVRGSEIKDCSCGVPELLSESNDVAVGEVKYEWAISGCTSEDAEPLTYRWEDGSSGATFTKFFTSAGSYNPTVKVTNTDGVERLVTCEGGKVVDANSPPEKIECKANLELTAGKYYFENCNWGTYNTTTTLEGCTDWFEGYSQMNADAEATTSCMGNFYCGDSPLTITVPENNKLIIYCWK